MPRINSVEYPVQGNKCRLVVGKNDLKKAFKHMIYIYSITKVLTLQTTATTTTPTIWTPVATPAIQTQQQYGGQQIFTVIGKRC